MSHLSEDHVECSNTVLYCLEDAEASPTWKTNADEMSESLRTREGPEEKKYVEQRLQRQADILLCIHDNIKQLRKRTSINHEQIAELRPLLGQTYSALYTSPYTRSDLFSSAAISINKLDPCITNQQKIEVEVRHTRKSDMPEIFAIEHASFDQPWSCERFREMLRKRMNIGLTATYNDRVVGFILFEMNQFYYQIINIAVDPQVRRKTVGRTLVNDLKKRLSQERRRVIAANVREANLLGQQFFRGNNFPDTHIVRDCISGEPGQEVLEDAYCMVHNFLNEHEFNLDMSWKTPLFDN